MTPLQFLRTGIRPALALLPPAMKSPKAEAMILAIALQESKLQHRRQVVIRRDGKRVPGPAHGFVQFERIGVAEVLRHPRSGPHARRVCADLEVEPEAGQVLAELEFDDVLCAAFARLYLWTLPMPLPNADDVDGAWSQYLRRWAPGKPHPHTWPAHWATAWATVRAAA